MKLSVSMANKEYDIHIQKGILEQLSKYVDCNKRYCIITDEGVPAKYLRTVKKQLPEAVTMVIPQGEQSKSLERLSTICNQLLMHHFGRDDVLIALGGGVIGDVVGFIASIYMRGISYINIPTTTLAQIDSSIGGKTAINFYGRKNVLGSYCHPELVLIDPEVLETLTPRIYNSGLIEALKMGLLKDRRLYEIFISGEENKKIEEVIYRALTVKKEIVEEDEKDNEIRRLLNYGHTLGHAFESLYEMQELFHGEAVLNGMLPMTRNQEILQILETIADRFNIEIKSEFKVSELIKYIKDDKKHHGNSISIIVIDDVEQSKIMNLTYHELEEELSKYYAR